LKDLLVKYLITDERDLLDEPRSIRPVIGLINDTNSPLMEFIRVRPYGKMKIVVIEEFQNASKEFQNELKAHVLDKAEKNNTFFIITTNNIGKMEAALKSRFYVENFENLSEEKMEKMVCNSLEKIGILHNSSEVSKLVKSRYRNGFRDIYNFIQANTKENIFVLPTDVKKFDNFTEEVVISKVPGYIKFFKTKLNETDRAVFLNGETMYESDGTSRNLEPFTEKYLDFTTNLVQSNFDLDFDYICAELIKGEEIPKTSKLTLINSLSKLNSYSNKSFIFIGILIDILLNEHLVMKRL
jgi:DNA polymerase III delta prime subunit